MKLYKFIVLITAMLPFTVLHSQTSATATDVLLGDALSSIIRDYNYDATIACYNLSNGITCFAYNSPNLQTKQVHLKGYYVNDFVISNDTVFFCGKTNRLVNDKGIIGFFDINDVFNNSGDFFVQDDFIIYHVQEEDEYAAEFYHLIAYLNSFGQRHIVCVGEGTKDHGCVVESIFNDYGVPPAFWSYFAGITEDKTIESFYDIMLYNDYVVTAGFYHNENMQLSLRVYNSDFVFDTYGPLNDRHTYDIQSAISGYSWAHDSVLLAYETNETFTTFTTLKVQSNTNPSRLHLASFNLSNLLANNNTGMIWSAELYNGFLTNYNRVDNIVIDSAQRKCLIMYNWDVPQVPFSNTSAFCELDYPLPYTTGTLPEFYFDGITLQGLTRYTAPAKYVMNGFFNSTPLNVFYSLETPGHLSGCADSSSIYHNDIRIILSTDREKKFITLLGLGNFHKEPQSNTAHTTIEIQCENNQ